MIISNLSNAFIPSDTTWGYRTPDTVKKITIHHAAGVSNSMNIAYHLQPASRKASANYCIGINGDITCGLSEDYIPCTSSNRDNDSQAITIECSNSKIGEPWKISNDTYKSLVSLCIDICLRYNIHMVKGDTLTWHSMFAATSCPGTYLLSKFDTICEEVNRQVNEIYTNVKQLSEDLVAIRSELEKIKMGLSETLINNDDDVKNAKLGKDSVEAIHYWKGVGVFNGKTNGYGLTYDMCRMLVLMYRAFNKF